MSLSYPGDDALLIFDYAIEMPGRGSTPISSYLKVESTRLLLSVIQCVGVPVQLEGTRLVIQSPFPNRFEKLHQHLPSASCYRSKC